MCKAYCGFVVFGAAVLAVLFAASARADLLFCDNFDDADSTGADYGLNQNLDTRQSSMYGVPSQNPGVGWVLATSMGTAKSTRASAARVNYSDTHGIADALALNNLNRSQQAVNINHNFTDQLILDAGGFTVRFDCAPVYTSSLYTEYPHRYSWVGVGGKQFSQSVSLTYPSGGNRDRAFMIKCSGSTHVYKGQNTYSPGDYFDTSRPTTTTSGFTCPIYTFELRVATTSFAPDSTASAALYWGPQGTPTNALTRINVNEGTSGPYMTWTWDSDNTNYITFGFTASIGTWLSNSTLTVYNMIDNVSVWSGMGTPEPSTLILAGTGVLGLLAYAWRRRRR